MNLKFLCVIIPDGYCSNIALITISGAPFAFSSAIEVSPQIDDLMRKIEIFIKYKDDISE